MNPATATTSPAEHTARLHSRRAIVEDFLALGVSRYAAFGLSFAVGIVQRRLLGPYLVGVWQILGLARQYLQYGDAGVLRGAEQKLPVLAAVSDSDEARFRDTAYTFVLLPVALSNATLIAVTFIGPWPADDVLRWGLRIMAVIALVETAGNIMESPALRVRVRFRLLGRQVLLSEGLFALLSIPALLVAGLWGLLAALLASQAFRIAFMRVTTQEWFRWRWDLPRAAVLWRLGFPLTLYVFLMKTFEALDRILLVHSRDLEALGHYSIASMTAIFLGHFPLIVSTVFFPRTMTWFEARERPELVRYFQKAQLCILVVVGGAAAVCYILMPLLVRAVLPTFTPGIGALKVSVFSATFVGLVQLPVQYQTAAQRQWTLVWVMAASTALYYGLGLLSSQWLEGPAVWLLFTAGARFVAYVLLAAAMSAWTLRSLDSHVGTWGWVMTAVSAHVILSTVGIDVLLSRFETTLVSASVMSACKLLLLAVAFWPLLTWVDRQTGALRELLAIAGSRWRPAT